MLFVYIIPNPDMKDVTNETSSIIAAKLTIPIIKLNRHTVTPIKNTFFEPNLSQKCPAVYAPTALPSPTKIKVIVRKVLLVYSEGANTKSSAQWKIYPTVIPLRN